jgi:hypothetical protein
MIASDSVILAECRAFARRPIVHGWSHTPPLILVRTAPDPELAPCFETGHPKTKSNAQPIIRLNGRKQIRRFAQDDKPGFYPANDEKGRAKPACFGIKGFADG